MSILGNSFRSSVTNGAFLFFQSQNLLEMISDGKLLVAQTERAVSVFYFGQSQSQTSNCSYLISSEDSMTFQDLRLEGPLITFSDSRKPLQIRSSSSIVFEKTIFQE